MPDTAGPVLGFDTSAAHCAAAVVSGGGVLGDGAGVQVLARAHRTGQVLGLPGPALPDPLPDLRGHFDAAAFVELAGPVLEQAERAGLPAFTSLVPTQLTRIVTGAHFGMRDWLCPSGQFQEEIDGVVVRPDGVHLDEQSVPMWWNRFWPEMEAAMGPHRRREVIGP